MKIKSVRFEGKGQVDIIATFENGQELTVITYFDDELSFSEDELIGLTYEECHKLHMSKDTSYLQS